MFPWLVPSHDDSGGSNLRRRAQSVKRSNDSSSIQGVLGQPPPCLSTVTASLLPVTASSVRFCFVGCGGIASHHLKALPPTALVTAMKPIVLKLSCRTPEARDKTESVRWRRCSHKQAALHAGRTEELRGAKSAGGAR